MKLLQFVSQKKFTLINIFLFLYIMLNLIDGERGLISYYQKQELKRELIIKNKALAAKLDDIEKKNSLLTDKIDLDYLEMLYRQKFMLGKKNEYLYKTN